MSLGQIALAGIVIAALLFLLVGRVIIPTKNKTQSTMLRASGLVYLSSTVVLYVFIRIRPVISIPQLILIEGLILLWHLFTLLLIRFMVHRMEQVAVKVINQIPIARCRNSVKHRNYVYTLNRKSTTSPSFMMYSLPSERTKPFSLAAL